MTVCDREGGSKLIKNSVTYFMDGPIPLSAWFVLSQDLKCLDVVIVYYMINTLKQFTL